MLGYNFKKAKQDLIYEVIAGSKAYGLDLPTSDTDIRGIYLQPNEFRLGNGYIEQVADKKNDIVYYEVNRFVNLLTNNNPNIIENLFVPEDKILGFSNEIKPLYDNRHKFLTKKIRQTFGGYAISQIKKARGLNKKIVNPIAKERKTPLDFCYIFEKETGYMKPAKKWLYYKGVKQSSVGLSEMPNGVQLYKMYLGLFRGIISENGNEVLHSEIPKDYPLTAFLYYNKDGYSTYCKEYKEYWEWVEKRNPVRYNDNISHDQNYDGKNMMHCLRMLDMAIEIAEGKGVNLVRPNREWLLSVRKGKVSYDEIMKLIEEKKKQMDTAFEKSRLPEEVDMDMAHKIIIQIREST